MTGTITRHDLSNRAAVAAARFGIPEDLLRDVEMLAKAWGRSRQHTLRVLLSRGIRDAISMRVCRDCACTEYDPCTDEQGHACYWVSEDLCSACAGA